MQKAVLAIFLALCLLPVYAQNTDFCNVIKKIITVVDTTHYKPKKLNDSLSKNVHKLFIENLDEEKIFFTATDIAQFKIDELSLDDYLINNDCSFIEKYSERLDYRINRIKNYLNELYNIALDYSGKDSLTYMAKKEIKHSKNETALLQHWNRRIRYRILRKMLEEEKDLNQIMGNFYIQEPLVKNKIIENELCLIAAFEQQNTTIKEFAEQAFYNAYLQYQDKNSSFITNAEKALFEQSVMASQLSFGIDTGKLKNGSIVISNISAGSPAFKNGNIQINDQILSVTTSTDTLETSCVSNLRVLNFINDSKINKAVFKLKKKNGTIKNIELTKKIVDVKDNTITGFLIKSDITIGYIKIPSFYTDQNIFSSKGLAYDVSKEIYKLKQQHIEGLIIDLRYNGGGSMQEAIDLSGMFVDRGPLAITNNNKDEHYTIKDPNRGKLFSKPVVVLINQYSASASEFFAAVLQDYNIALVIGTNSVGKATSQIIIPLDNSNTNFIKLTVGQFFRVTGKSHQHTGIAPDIKIPVILDNIKPDKFDIFNNIKNFEIEATMPYKSHKKPNISYLAEQSKIRIANNEITMAIHTLNTQYENEFYNRTGKYPLSLKFVYDDDKSYYEMWDTLEKKLNNNTTIFEVINIPQTSKIVAYDDDSKQINEDLRKTIATDYFIQEAYLVITDWLKI